MKKRFIPIHVFLLAAFSCDVNQLEFDNLKEPAITSLVAVPIGEIEYNVRELIDELNDDVLTLEEDPETTLISLIYTDTFSYASSNDLIDVGDVSNSAAVGLPTTPVSPTPISVPINETFTFSFPATNQEQIDSVVYSGGQLTLDVSSTVDPVVNFGITVFNTTDANGNPVVFTGSVSNSTFSATENLAGASSSLSIQGSQNTFQVGFQGTVEVLAGQSLQSTDSVRFTLTYQNQAFQILFGNFGNDRVQVSNSAIDIDFFADLGGENAIEFQAPQISINYTNNIGIPIGLAFDQVFAATEDDQGNLSDTTFLEGNVVDNPPLINGPTVENIGTTIMDTLLIDRNNSTLNKLFAEAPNQIIFDVFAVTNPGGVNRQNFFIPGNSSLSGIVVFRLPLALKLTDLIREQSFPLGELNFTEADSVVLRVVTANLLPFNTRMDLQILDENDMILFEVPNKLVTVTPFLNVDFVATEPEVNVARIPLGPDGIDALNNGDRINLVLTMNTPVTLNSQEIFPKILGRYSISIKISVIGKLNIDINELGG